jgi:hypothetical protein
MPSFNRDKAIEYAKAYWTIPCKDDLLGAAWGRPSISSLRHKLKAPAPDWKALFVRDGTGTERGVFRKTSETDKVFQGWDGLDDCAHYVSQCFREGGASINTQWGARELKESLEALPQTQTKTLIDKVDQKVGQRIVDAELLKEGDAIIYYTSVPSGESHVGFHHSAMYVGDGGITCHSVCRYKGLGDSSDDEWHLNQGDVLKYTFIHFSSDDFTTPNVVKALTGWWKVEYAGKTSYSFFLSDGRARKSPTAPRSTADQFAAGKVAYWFQIQNSVKIVWKEAGDVEEWPVSDIAKGTAVNGTINGTAAKVTKLP